MDPLVGYELLCGKSNAQKWSKRRKQATEWNQLCRLAEVEDARGL